MQTEFISNNTYMVKRIDAKDAREIVKKYHYSGKVVANSNLHLGVFNLDGVLVGCLQFGPPMNGNKTSLKLSDSLPMLELNRMVMADSEPRNSESMAISLCLKFLRRFTDCQWVLSFSDGKESNVGYIYQATNWQYLGYMLSDSFYRLDGNYMHNVSVWHKYKEKHPDRDVKTTNQILCDNFKDISKVTCKQHIYVMPVAKRVAFKFAPKPYPKKDTEVAVVKEVFLKMAGTVLEKKQVVLHSGEALCPII